MPSAPPNTYVSEKAPLLCRLGHPIPGFPYLASWVQALSVSEPHSSTVFDTVFGRIGLPPPSLWALGG